ncbi:uncharacterized protein LOC122531188 [Frieseomelitta varia]|uniref:uncharacterized protein LOC122531188 n=1 Tax=Frieseomelitta varia TaxID=561572 RepID=UPI001CB69D98|nr:uncharacterized protein LOC122531188 [Frieseomelitta varia]
MQYNTFCVLLLAISEPLLTHANKVVLVIPQQTRRSLGPSSWRLSSTRYRKSPHAGEVHYHKYHTTPVYYRSKKPIHETPPAPHGGDDFDQGYEHVNHVHIPYGKGINHGVSFGKGYIPYDQIKGSFSLGRERNPSSHKQTSDYSSPPFSSSDTDYSPSSYEAPQPETFFPDPETALNYDERQDDRNKFYSSRSIEKDLLVNNPVELSAAKDQILLLQQKATDLYKNVVSQPQGGVLLPAGVPSPTIGGSKEGIVLKDTVALDEYQQKLQEMTKSWPQFLSNAANALGNSYQSQQVTASYTTDGSATSGSLNGWSASFAQPKQGYDVKEDNVEPPHDFRTAPIHSPPYHAFSVPGNVALPAVAQTVHG